MTTQIRPDELIRILKAEFGYTGGGGVAFHNLLSATHTDTLASAVSRGSIIVGNNTPAYAELVHPAAAGHILTTDVNDTLWSLYKVSGTAGQTYTFPAVGGSVTLGAGTLTVATINDATIANHTHAITSSSNPGAAESILASNASGYLQLQRFGAGVAPGYPLHALATTEQMRLAYDAGNYLSTTVGATGLVTLDAVGAGAGFRLNDTVGVGTAPVSTIAGSFLVTGSSNVATVYYGLRAEAQWSPSADAFTSSAYGMTFKATLMTAFAQASGGMSGLIGFCEIASGIAGSVTSATGGYFYTTINDGSASVARGVYARTTGLVNGSTTYDYGIYVDAGTITGTGVKTNQYGIYIAAMTQATTNWGIFNANSPLYFRYDDTDADPSLKNIMSIVSSGGRSFYLKFEPTTYDLSVVKLYSGVTERVATISRQYGHISILGSSGAAKLYFRDTAIGIYSQADSYLDIFADGGIRFGDSSGGAPTNYAQISPTGVITYSGSAKRSLTLRPQLYSGRSGGVSKPTFVTLGAYGGYSFPVFASDDEELFFREHIPGRWDGASNITAYIVCYLSAAEDVGDNFKFQVSWANHVNSSGQLSNSTTDVVAEQAVLAGRSAQYSIYTLSFAIDWDIVDPDVVAGDHFGGRIRRLNATDPDVSNEIVVVDFYMSYTVDKVFKAP